jgi:hypothetical protein
LGNNDEIFRFPRVSCGTNNAEDADVDPCIAGKILFKVVPLNFKQIWSVEFNGTFKIIKICYMVDTGYYLSFIWNASLHGFSPGCRKGALGCEPLVQLMHRISLYI